MEKNNQHKLLEFAGGGGGGLFRPPLHIIDKDTTLFFLPVQVTDSEDKFLAADNTHLLSLQLLTIESTL